MENESGISADYLPMDPKRLLERMHTALNTRDLTNLLILLQVDFEQLDPANPGNDRVGLEAAREAWDRIFTNYPDFQADLIREAIEGTTIWTEWHWHGTNSRDQGETLNRVGVLILGVEGGLIAWSRSYMTEVVEKE